MTRKHVKNRTPTRCHRTVSCKVSDEKAPLRERVARIGRFLVNLFDSPSDAWDWSKYPESCGYAAALLRWNRNSKRRSTAAYTKRNNS